MCLRMFLLRPRLVVIPASAVAIDLAPLEAAVPGRGDVVLVVRVAVGSDDPV